MSITIKSKNTGNHMIDARNWTPEAAEAQIFETMPEVQRYIMDVLSGGSKSTYNNMAGNLVAVVDGKVTKIEKLFIDDDGPSGYGW